ncbi:MAG: hypothetical protein IPH63_17690 [Flavobacteriales bacterium]|nr:hypothetical protein [Flavobacteriales bacterium]
MSTFSIDQIKWLLNERGCHIGIERFENTEFDLNQVLAATLPTLERHETTAGSDNMELIDSLTGGRVDRCVSWSLNWIDPSAGPLVKDLLFDGLGLYVRIIHGTEPSARPTMRCRYLDPSSTTRSQAIWGQPHCWMSLCPHPLHSPLANFNARSGGEIVDGADRS